MTKMISGAVATPPELSQQPTVSLHGPVDETMLSLWLDALATVRDGSAALVLELSTTGGDADVGRRMAEDVRLFRERTGRRALFLGRTTVYSAGVTIMSGFRRADRWLSEDAVLMIHGRKLQETLTIDGPLRFERPRVEALLSGIDEGLRIERKGFEQLIEGSDIAMDELEKQTVGDWYLTGEQALKRRLIAGLI